MCTKDPTVIDVAAWVDSKSDDPVVTHLRQATHITLAAIAKMRHDHTLYLKGGILLGLVYNNQRMTDDVDFTAGFSSTSDIDVQIETALNRLLPATAAELGYTGTQTRVHNVQKMPKPLSDRIEEANFPALEVKIEHVLPNGSRGPKPLKVEISFKEPDITSVEVLDIGGLELYAYSLTDVIAEKIRALLQQAVRKKKGRRQDVYDIHFLLGRSDFGDKERAEILHSLLRKCETRLPSSPDVDSIDDPIIKEKAQVEWDDIRLETGTLPDFEACFRKVRGFYRDLPWPPKASSD